MQSQPLKGKKILIGITGGIAAYKIPLLIRLLVKAGCEVKVITTTQALDFVTPLTLSTLSQNPVYIDFFDKTNGSWHSHIELGRWADLFVIAPATANTIAKLTYGLADNLLTTTYLASNVHKFIYPAMDVDMYNHTTTQTNILKLKQIPDTTIFEAEKGELASGLSGKGRLPEPENIFQDILQYFSKTNTLSKKTFIVTAGPTYEKIDTVRFIGNFSSGKMGYAIAEELANRGAKVHLISGPTYLTPKHYNITLHKVISAKEMLEKSKKLFPSSDGAIMVAAVSDYRPTQQQKKKIKREENPKIIIELEANPDIAKTLGQIKKVNQILVGFALETKYNINNAKQKLQNKNLDFIVLNSIEKPNTGFGTDTNQITIIDKYNNKFDFELKQKHEVAKDIVDYLIKLIEKQ